MRLHEGRKDVLVHGLSSMSHDLGDNDVGNSDGVLNKKKNVYGFLIYYTDGIFNTDSIYIKIHSWTLKEGSIKFLYIWLYII